MVVNYVAASYVAASYVAASYVAASYVAASYVAASYVAASYVVTMDGGYLCGSYGWRLLYLSIRLQECFASDFIGCPDRPAYCIL